MDFTEAVLEKNFELKNIFNETMVKQIAERIGSVYPEFDRGGFVSAIMEKLSQLELKERSRLIAETLRAFLPADYPKAVRIILNALPPELESEDLTGTDSFAIMPFCNFVGLYGQAHFAISTSALYEMTKRFTAEEDIRYFIERYPQQTLALLEKWSSDPNVHVRRLVSESTRPRLPWAMHLPVFIKDPQAVIRLLEKLRHSPELYVRRSIANNLNDISKDNPETVLTLLKKWKTEQNAGIDWIIRHATRTLVKQGHPAALALLGFTGNPKLSLLDFKLKPNELKFGDTLEFSFKLRSDSSRQQNLVIDYIIDFMKAGGKTAPKVFKLSQKTIQPGETISFTKKQSFVPLTTRRYYPGMHAVSLQVNGKILDKKTFRLLM